MGLEPRRELQNVCVCVCVYGICLLPQAIIICLSSIPILPPLVFLCLLVDDLYGGVLAIAENASRWFDLEDVVSSALHFERRLHFVLVRYFDCCPNLASRIAVQYYLQQVAL